jgi:DNA-binding transcriptional MocR family regulator
MEITLANELGVSRTPVRGAMARLADEGLLVYVPHKGFQVRRFNAKDVFDAFSVRATSKAWPAGCSASAGWRRTPRRGWRRCWKSSTRCCMATSGATPTLGAGTT